ncbi:MutS-related protein [Cardinium endosymbiont of Philonthus spinipes]|uniref:MutS-related protein n=1 Tax=Cardinium endosymbiont of Philonthus spinipes TaxID=3077941 RepID=UPI00313A7960
MRIISFISTAFIFCLPVSVEAVDKRPSMAIQVADYYLKSFPEAPEPLTKALFAKKAKASDTNITDVHLSPRAARALVFNEVFAESSYYQDQYQQAGKLLNPYAWNDLHLFCGTTTTPTYHVLSRINKTITVLGEGALASLIAAPIADIEVLTKRQQCIDFLLQNKQLYNDLQSELQRYKSSEKGMLSFWTETDPLYTKEYDKYLTNLFYKPSAAANKSAFLLQRRKILLRDVWNIYTNYIWYPIIIGLPFTEISYLVATKRIAKGKDVPRGLFYAELYWLFIPLYNLCYLGREVLKKSISVDTKFSMWFNSGMYTIHSFWQYYKGYRNYKEYSGVLKNLALRMADVQTFLTTAKKINVLIEQNAELEALYGLQLQPIRELLACRNKSSEVGNLLRYLEELPLRSWSYLWDNAGKLLASYKLFVEYKAVFHDAMYALGALDALLSIATLMKETAAVGGPHAYTFTKFLSPKAYTKPRLALVEMWNPMLTPTTAVGNDVVMDSATKTQNIILTGPNAGGKSTFLTGVATTVLLSQTFGIAPAKSCEMTPFSKINTYIDITDDIAAGKSLFLAEVDRFQSHLNLLKPLKDHEFSFTIFDEPFSGTNPVEGAAAEYSVLNYIARYGNALNIVATHYPIVMLLEGREPQKGFKNYKVFIKPIGKDGKIQYTYKVIPGASNQTIAIDILEEQGYATQMLQQARDIISHPERYEKSFSKK